jgi:hypothetical protein
MIPFIVLLSSTTPIEIPPEEWVAPDVEIVEEWVLRPSDFTEIRDGHAGNVSESDNNSEHTWDITILGEDRLYRFTDDILSSAVDIDLPSREWTLVGFSPNGKFMLLNNGAEKGCQRIDLDSMIFNQFAMNTGTVAHPIGITDNGSIISRIMDQGDSEAFCISDPDGHPEVNLWDGAGFYYRERFTYATECNRFFYTQLNDVYAVDSYGNELWRTSIGVWPEDYLERHRIPVSEMDDIADFITCSSGSVLAITQVHKLSLFDGTSGELFFEKELNTNAGTPILSETGRYLAFDTQYSTESGIDEGYIVFELASNPPAVSGILDRNKTLSGIHIVELLAVSDNGMVLVRLFPSESIYRLMLFDYTGEVLWTSSCYNWPWRTSLSGIQPETDHFISNAGMSNDGTHVWFFDGDLIHSYRMQRLL